MSSTDAPSVVVIGLGYVGLPLAVALARHFAVIGIDIDETRIVELRRGYDRTAEIDGDRLAATDMTFSSDPADGDDADIYIVTVPTPVDDDNKPDLRPLIGASSAVGGMLRARRKPIVVYESTVYPGVTETICGPLLEERSGLTCGTEFFLGYSPERINPGDREHTVDRIIKVIAGQTPEVTERLAQLYGSVTSAGVFRAASIKAAEAAKVIENAQRDINIAFMNEITQIFANSGLSIWDVLAAAGTKWNFLPFQPGLVGGHCIGVDPYYLSFLSQQLGHNPRVILAGRHTNDGMARWIAETLHTATGAKTALVMGATFKENVPDIRNSKSLDLVVRLRELGVEVTVHDPLANPAELQHEYGLALDQAALTRQYDLIVCAVSHDAYRRMSPTDIGRLAGKGGMIADLKNIWRDVTFDSTINRWTL